MIRDRTPGASPDGARLRQVFIPQVLNFAADIFRKKDIVDRRQGAKEKHNLAIGERWRLEHHTIESHFFIIVHNNRF